MVIQDQLRFSSVDTHKKVSYLKIKKSIRIAISGDVHVTELKSKIIDTPEFQRLRLIRQLGTAYLVYPTALHTRFDHSLGVLFMTQVMINAIRTNTHSTVEDEYLITDEQVALARLYALLHDITHIPFGHTLEDELGILDRHDENKLRIKHFVGPNSTIGSLIISTLGKEVFKRFHDVFTWNSKTPTPLAHNDEFIYDLVSNTVCADLLDYLARDSYFCNLEPPPEYRFLKFMYLDRDTNGCRHPVIRLRKPGKAPRRDLLTDLTRLLDARYLLAERVYFHHAKMVTAAMLGRALFEAQQAGELDEQELMKRGDLDVLNLLSKSASAIAKELSQRLKARRLFKIADKCTLNEGDFQKAKSHRHDVNPMDTAFLRLADPLGKLDLENDLAAIVNAQPGEVLLYGLSPENTNAKLADIHVTWQGSVQKLRHIESSRITDRLKHIINSHKELWGIRVVVPAHLRNDEPRMKLLKEAAESELLDGTSNTSVYSSALRLRLQSSKSPAGVEYTEGELQISSKATELMANPRGSSLEDSLRAAVGEIKKTDESTAGPEHGSEG